MKNPIRRLREKLGMLEFRIAAAERNLDKQFDRVLKLEKDLKARTENLQGWGDNSQGITGMGNNWWMTPEGEVKATGFSINGGVGVDIDTANPESKEEVLDRIRSRESVQSWAYSKATEGSGWQLIHNRALSNLIEASRDSGHPYHEPALVLLDAFDQMSGGKGHERHANDRPFRDQPIHTISNTLDSEDGLIFQVTKKLEEAKRLPATAAYNEALGSIVYATAIAMRHHARKEKNQ